ncbi:MAG: phenylalanine--tRNA ligase subunit alpha, partial [Caldilineaceae bacterium]|nr:phenylalanine--tRNA ligase subunit alpha [Caldilineaceae bacterium]
MEELQQEAVTALAKTASREESEAWFREYLGRQGKMTAILRGLGQLSKEERPAVGQAA